MLSLKHIDTVNVKRHRLQNFRLKNKKKTLNKQMKKSDKLLYQIKSYTSTVLVHC